MPVTILVDGTPRNGEKIVTTLTADGKAAPSQETTIAALPQLNLVKNTGSAVGTTTLNGVTGRVINYTAAIGAPNRAKGTELVTEDLHWIDEVNQISPHAQLVDCRVYNGFDANYGLPYGKIGDPSGNSAANSVVDSGALTCEQPGGPGTNINFAVSGANLSGSSIPSMTSNGAPLPVETAYLATYAFQVFIPLDDFANAPDGQLNTVNQFRGFDPNSISGQSNFGDGFEPGGAPDAPACVFTGETNDNCKAIGTQVSSGQMVKFLTSSDDVNPAAPAGAASDFGGGNGTVGEGAHYYSLMDLGNFGATDFAAPAICDKWDPATQKIVGAARVWKNNVLQTVGVDYTVEYAALPMDSDDARRATACDSGTWFPTVAAAGGADVVNAVRYLPIGGLASMSNFRTYTEFASPALPSGTVIGDWAGGRFEDTPNWGGSSYDKDAHTGYMGDRLIASNATLRISKNTDPAEITNIAAGSSVKYVLKPQVRENSPLTPTAVHGVKITDTISSCVQYKDGSASIPVVVTPGNDGADGIACTGDAGETGQTLTFDLGDVVPNTDIAPINYEVVTSSTTPDDTHIPNTAVISSETAVSQDLTLRTAQYDIVVRNQARFAVSKSVDTPLVEINDPYSYTISYRNLTGNNIAQAQLIDEFPNDQDSRGSNFTGTTSFDGVSALQGNAAVECTTDAHGTIDPDPSSTTNTWSSDCPANTTAIRITVTDIAAGGIGSAKVSFTPTANAAGNDYVNSVAGARSSDTDLLIPETVPVAVTVVSSTIGDFVWRDLNANGIQDSGEPGVANFPVKLTGTDANGKAVTVTTTTDSGGMYHFVGLHSGTYTVTFDPAGLASGDSFTLQHAGSDGLLDSDGDSKTGVTDQITLGIDSSDLGWDQGIVTEPTTTTTAPTTTTTEPTTTTTEPTTTTTEPTT
ncbi:SdrD B-like domain-containing protein, partial [Rhodococcus erythropolis]|uniref:SdrD B-like domain-containing protein n=1 Tax=Rhodococcus erythropolis TaxID=1833 RepID=UPI00366C40D7